jgi:hypothetical protein
LKETFSTAFLLSLFPAREDPSSGGHKHLVKESGPYRCIHTDVLYYAQGMPPPAKKQPVQIGINIAVNQVTLTYLPKNSNLECTYLHKSMKKSDVKRKYES